MTDAIKEAMWAGDVDALNELAPCQCCCGEHIFLEGCPAWQWGGCRGQGSMTRADEESWKRHYMANHGMTEDQFYGVNEIRESD